MGITADDWGQTCLFPKASKQEIEEAKRQLGRYRWYKAIIADLKEREELTEKQRGKLREYAEIVRNLDSAVRLILDTETREIVEYRYIKGNRHKDTISEFGNRMDDRTVERRLLKGIEAVAFTLRTYS